MSPTCPPAATHRPACAQVLELLRRCQALWAAWREIRRQRRAQEDLLALDTRTLADIGVPEDWLGQARARRRSCREHLGLERQGLGSRVAWW